VFEIGISLREARIRQGLELSDAEQATKIRSKYLSGLEEERFEVLPAQTYVKGFLRAYAEYLGLDGQIYVDEYNSRFFTGDDETPYRTKRVRRPTPHHRRMESSVLLIALAGISAATALVIVAWRYGGDEPRRNTIPNLPSATPPAAVSPQPAAAPEVTTPRRWVALVLTAVDGDTYLAARRGGAAGRVLFTGTLEKGRSQRFVGPEIWINLGAPRNIVATIDGKPAALGVRGSQPAVLIATRAGFIQAGTG
jgi:hypothetical protein